MNDGTIETVNKKIAIDGKYLIEINAKDKVFWLERL